MAKHIWESLINEENILRCQRCGYDKYPQILSKFADGTGRKILCPNCVVLLVANGELSFTNDPNLVDDITGKPGAIEYVSDNERYVLEQETMKRLVTHNLTQKEWQALSHKYGESQYMLHEDFYDEDGVALQPVVPQTRKNFYGF